MKAKKFKQLRLSGARRLTCGLTNHEHPTVSPDGRRLAYYSGEYGSICIIMADIRGRFARRVSPHGGNNTQPAWHPSGTQLAFRHQHTTEHPWELWLAPLLPGSQPQPLLADPQWNFKHPHFSPDGDTLAYFSDEGSANIYHLWLLDLLTLARQQLTFGDSQNHCHPAFSPDGARLVFHAYEGIDMQEPPVTNLYELELASGEIRQLSSGEDQYKHPFYLTNSVITYHHERNSDGRRRLEALSLKSGRLVKLTSGKKNDKHPFPWWDGKGRPWLAWSSKKLGPEGELEPATYDIFAARLKS